MNPGEMERTWTLKRGEAYNMGRQYGMLCVCAVAPPGVRRSVRYRTFRGLPRVALPGLAWRRGRRGADWRAPAGSYKFCINSDVPPGTQPQNRFLIGFSA